MAIPLAAAVTSFVICFLIIPVIIKYSLEKNLVDIPGRRKIHKKVTPSMGGIAIFIGFFIGSLIWTDISQWKEIRMILIALFMVFFVGVRDDLVPLKPYMKLIGQLVAATILILLFDLRIKSMYGLFGLYEIPTTLSYILTVFTIIVITNSFNLIDGLDGLAASLAIISLLAFGIWFILADDGVFAVLSFGMVGALIAFLIFNWEPSKIFMGDTGALVVGMMLAITAIHFINHNYNLPAEHAYRFSGSVAPAICFIIVPLVDTMRIFILRIARKQSPFTPDKSHIHHSIMRLGFSHRKTTILLSFIQSFYIVMAIFMHSVNDNYLLLTVMLLSVALSVALDQLILTRLNKDEQSV
ncbi:MAG: undecaprenyl/decaprenyl-phosphate alpha-N-acetylglucosaminyl 1-phosphate transferase [Cyclobacteriaceae bacterium]|nr:undecaprenyl/decaprenyl-phosphate alpha-N-acetylglucosaminyl 1-phosphate transferase [Cyclobacteriaceae bacterium]UYN86684.1 MAG: undecaprenyl/decaprenyl-phosphate alpha-N-acetylglucosaminyl 1-phosphate transferase [Cyclobacteriaceae bacterium]